MRRQLTWLRNHLTYANVCATIALVTAIGGSTAWAATVIYSGNIADNTIRSRDVRNGGLSGADIANGSVGRADFAPSALTLATLDGTPCAKDGKQGTLTHSIAGSNGAQPVTLTCTFAVVAPPPDSSEPNDTQATAAPLSPFGNGSIYNWEVLDRNFHSLTDVDWYSVTIECPLRYVDGGPTWYTTAANQYLYAESYWDPKLGGRFTVYKGGNLTSTGVGCAPGDTGPTVLHIKLLAPANELDLVNNSYIFQVSDYWFRTQGFYSETTPPW